MSTKGFSLIELLVVIAILGIITSTGFLFLQDSLRDSRIQNEFTHTLQLIKKYAKQSLTSQEPMLINFSYTSSGTTASIYKMDENDFSRFNKTDCDGIYPLVPERISETNITFSNVFIRACDDSGDIDIDDSGDIDICFTGRGGFVDPTTVYILPYRDFVCKSLLDSDNEVVPHQRQITLYTSGYIDDPSR